MSPQQVGDYHRTLDRIERNHWWFVALREYVVATVTARLPAGSRLLDAGCSTGHVIAAVPDGYERTGADISAGAIELARSVRPGIRFLEAPVQDLPFEGASLDCVIALDLLSDRGVPDEGTALREIARVLRPGGLLLAQFPAYEWLRSGYDDAVATARRYTAGAVGALLGGQGFGMEHLTYRITTLFPVAAARRLLTGGVNTSDLRVPRPRLNRLLAAVTMREDQIALRHRLPFGLSVFAVAQR